MQLVEAPVSIKALHFFCCSLAGIKAFSSFPITTSSTLSLPDLFNECSSGRYPLSSHSSESLSVVQDEELSSESTSVMFSPSSPLLLSLVSPVSIIDTGSVFTLAFGTELDVVVTVVVVVLFILLLALTFPFDVGLLGVVFFANVTVFLGDVFSVAVKLASCFLFLTSSNSCLVFFNFVLAAVYFFFSFSVCLKFLYMKSERLLSVTGVCASMVWVTVPIILCWGSVFSSSPSLGQSFLEVSGFTAFVTMIESLRPSWSRTPIINGHITDFFFYAHNLTNISSK